MARARIKKALKPLQAYINLTVIEPYNTIKDIRKENAIASSKPAATYSIRDLIKKQNQMTSPNTESSTVCPTYGLRGGFLKSLNSSDKYITRIH